ncbi:hypothetical protein C4572_00820 [Candidatus Parcubacteria bacterium]|nr:MAG: hypothetical protein C4572_00820 [Candidatus Parcubacteria bacterium]
MRWNEGFKLSSFYCIGKVTHDGAGKPVGVNKNTGLPKMPRGYLKGISDFFKRKQGIETEKNKCGIAEAIENLSIPSTNLNSYGIPVK